jgi:hypothetical protein
LNELFGINWSGYILDWIQGQNGLKKVFWKTVTDERYMSLRLLMTTFILTPSFTLFFSDEYEISDFDAASLLFTSLKQVKSSVLMLFFCFLSYNVRKSWVKFSVRVYYCQTIQKGSGNFSHVVNFIVESISLHNTVYPKAKSRN